MKCSNCLFNIKKCFICDMKFKVGDKINCIDGGHIHDDCFEVEYPEEFKVIE